MKFAVQLWGVLNVIIPYYTYLCVYVYLCWPVSPEMQTDTGPGKISMMD